MIIPFPAGRSIDIVARAVSQRWSAQLGQPIVIDNRGGAGGALGTQLVHGIVAPAKTPKAVISKLQQTLAATLSNPELREQLATREDSEAIGSTPEEFAKLMRTEYDRWGKMIKAIGVKGE